MGDLFYTDELRKLLFNKFVVVIGDSNMRGMYKDIVLLLQENSLLAQRHLRSKGERSHCGDKLIEGGLFDKLHNGKNYREIRNYQTDCHMVRFYFVTRCYNEYFETILDELKRDPIPDVIIMNSCVWDITRYGPRGMDLYKINLQKMFRRLKEELPEETLIIWNTTLPLAKNIRGGFLLRPINFLQETLRFDIVEANFYARQVAVDYNCDVLDLHYTFRHLLKHRVKDGIHWDNIAQRRISNMVLTHISHSWRVPLPGRRTFEFQPVSKNQSFSLLEDQTFYSKHQEDIDVEESRRSGRSWRSNQDRLGERPCSLLGRVDYSNMQGGGMDRRRTHMRSDSCDPSMMRGNYSSMNMPSPQRLSSNYNFEMNRNMNMHQHTRPLMENCETRRMFSGGNRGMIYDEPDRNNNFADTDLSGMRNFDSSGNMQCKSNFFGNGGLATLSQERNVLCNLSSQNNFNWQPYGMHGHNSSMRGERHRGYHRNGPY